MITHTKNISGVTPVIGVILLVAIFTLTVSLISFNLFSSNTGVVDADIDADIDFQQHDAGVVVSVWQNENIDNLFIRYNDDEEVTIELDSQEPTTNIDFGPGSYYLIAEYDDNKQRIISTKRVAEKIQINIPDSASTDETIQYSIDTNVNENNITSYQWDFGDGNTSSESNPEHFYSDNGTYTTNITITLDDDEELSEEKDILVDSSFSSREEPDNTGDVLANMSGSGTESNPYIILNEYDLQAVSEDLSAYYELGDNINTSNTINWNNGNGFESLGNSSDPFTGNLNGNDYIITGLGIDRPETSFVGLFGNVNTASISNVGLENIYINGQSEVGGLVGSNINGNIDNSYSTGVVEGTGNFRTGGLVGYNTDDSTISNSFSTTTIQSNGNNIGGIAGKNENSTIIQSYAISDLSGDNNNIGGLVGTNVGGEIIQSYAQGDINGQNNTYVGSVVGYNRQGTIDRVYGTGLINSEGTIGGLVGNNEDTITDSYWDTESTNQLDSIGSNSGDATNLTGLNTVEMTGSEAEDNMTTFDFIDIWYTLNEEYPILQWQNDTELIAVAQVDEDVKSTSDNFEFSASNSTSENTNIDSYEWDFDDGNSSNGEFVTHSYDETGEYTVKLTVISENSFTSEDTINITVSDSEGSVDTVESEITYE